MLIDDESSPEKKLRPIKELSGNYKYTKISAFDGTSEEDRFKKLHSPYHSDEYEKIKEYIMQQRKEWHE